MKTRREEPVEMGSEIAYHRTTLEKLGGILRAGLLCRKATRKFNDLWGVWLGKTPDYHGDILFGDVLLGVNIAGLKKADLNDNEWEICITEDIPPDRILFELVEMGGSDEG